MTTEKPTILETEISDQINPKEKPTTESSSNKFYNTGWWAIIWCLLFWPIGLFLMWRFYGKKMKTELPRTTTIDKPLENL